MFCSEKLNAGDYIIGVVVERQTFGVFLDIGEEFRGLVLVPHMGKENIQVKDYPKVGENIYTKILGFSKHPTDIKYSYVSLEMVRDSNQ